MTEVEYRAAIAELDRLWGSPVGTPDGDKLDRVLEKIGRYEKEHYRFARPYMCEAIEFAMNRLGVVSYKGVNL